MKCRDDAVLLSRYLEQDLSAEEQEEIAAHLAACGRCRKELERLETAMAIMRSVQDVPAPRDYAAYLQEKLKQG